MGKVALMATLRAKEGQRGELVEVIKSSLGAINKESGTIYYILHEHDTDADALVFYELYEDAEALGAHGSGEALKELGPKMGPFLAGRPELVRLTPVAGKGL
jgi:quinol monooxygenase YgiN